MESEEVVSEDVGVPKNKNNQIKTVPTQVENKEQDDRKIPEEMAEDLAKNYPGSLEPMRALFAMSSQIVGNQRNQLFEKFTAAHIDKYLDYIQRDDDHEYEIKKSNRWFYLVYAILALSVFIAGVVYLLPRDKDLLVQLINIIILFGGGIGAGIGLSKRKSE